MIHTWKGYEDKAWGADELKPRSGRPQNNWGGMGMTLLDSLDVLWIMGMKDEFKRARDWVRCGWVLFRDACCVTRAACALGRHHPHLACAWPCPVCAGCGPPELCQAAQRVVL